MAEEPVTKWWAVGAKEEATARKYISFLHKHSMFGGHVGLPQDIRNEKPNRSLDSSRGIYDMVEVYSVANTSCPTGTVVNFYVGDDINNPLGTTYVKPCYDTTKPMGYMVTKAAPDIYGICVVSGVLEVPLANVRGLSSDEFKRKDYVEYDLEAASFAFSDSGYPVFNVYQDVDGDWIAIILFGNTKSDYEYDGPFAVSVTGVTGSTMYVDVASGDIIREGVRTTCDEDLMQNIALSTGESLWLGVPIGATGGTWSYITQSTEPIAGGTTFYRIAENDAGELRQLQYGDIFNDIQHLQVISVTGNTAHIRITGYSSSNIVEDHLMLRGVGCTFNTLGSNDIGIIVEGGTGGSGGEVQNLYASITGGTPSIRLTGSTSYINVVGGTNCYTELGSNGEIIIGSTVSGGTSSSFDYTGSFKVDCWDTEDEGVVHNVRIYDTNNRDDMVEYAGWVHIGNQKYHVPVYSATFSDGDVIYLIGTFNESNELSSFEFRKIQTFFPTINDNQFCVRICYATNGKMYQTQYGDIVQPARLVGDGATVEIHNNVISASGGGSSNNYYINTRTTYNSNVGFSNAVQMNADSVYNLYCKPTGTNSFSSNDIILAYPSLSGKVDDSGEVLFLLPVILSGQTQEVFVEIYRFTRINTVILSTDGVNIVEYNTNHKNCSHPDINNGHQKLIYVPDSKVDNDLITYFGISDYYEKGLWILQWC